jgi:hypothetical protein
MTKWIRRALAAAGIVLAPVGALYLLAILPIFGMVLIPAYLVWEIMRHPSKKEAERRERQKEERKAEALIQYHLIAHKLADTPANRARVLAGLCRPAARRRPRR